MSEPHDVQIASLVLQVVQVLAWPAVVAFVLWTYRGPVGTLLTSGTVSVKAGGVQISTAARAAAASALQSAAQDKATPLDPDAARSRVDADAEALATRPAPPRVLWVDDRPSANRYECAALTRLGMVVTQVVSTEAALSAVLRSAPFDVIVSDMARPESPTAGYDLLDRLRADGVRTPFVVYSGSADPAHDDEAVAHGALGGTNDPAVLLELLAQALLRQPAPGAGA